MTASEIRNSYIFYLKSPVENKRLYQYLYRQLTKLCNEELIKKLPQKHTNRPLFLPTDLFFKTLFIPKKTIRNASDFESINNKFVNFLEEEFSTYQADFEICKAEHQEYERLQTIIPSLGVQLQKRFQITMCRSHQLIGKMNAVKNVLKAYK